MPAVLVHGVVTRRFTVDLAGAGRVSAVKFRPGGFAAFTGVLPGPRQRRPAAGRARRSTAADLLAAVLAEDDDDARAAVLDAALAAARARRRPTRTSTCSAWSAAMIEDRSLVRVDQVAALGGDERPVAAAAVRRRTSA